jgi:hypothetical protein
MKLDRGYLACELANTNIEGTFLGENTAKKKMKKY